MKTNHHLNYYRERAIDARNALFIILVCELILRAINVTTTPDQLTERSFLAGSVGALAIITSVAQLVGLLYGFYAAMRINLMVKADDAEGNVFDNIIDDTFNDPNS